MRGENNKLPYGSARIVDMAGETKYHIIPNRLIIIGLACLALLLIIAIILGALIISNKWEINTLREQVSPIQENK